MLLFYLFTWTLLGTTRADIKSITEDRTHFKKDLLNWEPPEDLKKKFPYYHSGYDYENRPVMVFPWGKWYTRSIAERGGREFEDLQKLQDLFLERVKTAYFSRNDSETGVLVDECVIIGDLEGYNNTEFSSLENLKYLIGYFSKFERVYDKFAYGFIINSSTVATQFERLMHSFMAKFTAGTEVYGTNPKVWIPRLLRKIPQDQLPPEYGGFPSFKPVAVYG